MPFDNDIYTITFYVDAEHYRACSMFHNSDELVQCIEYDSTYAVTTAATTTTANPEPNTTEMIDFISENAKYDAATATPEDLQAALDTLRTLSGNFCASNDTMQGVMYNAQLLYYYYENTDTPYEQVGFYAFTAVKYVYRGVDTVDSTDTSDSLIKFAAALLQCDDIVAQKTEEPTEPPTENNITLGMKNALEEAKSYIRYSSFSYTGLIDQLEYEGYTYEECVYGADNCGADWYEQAVLSAESYIEYSAFSYLGLIDQLEYEGFTSDEAAHGADNCGADWYEEAAECAQSYMDYSSFSRQELLDQLLYEEFTYDEAEYGVQSVGY